MPATLRHVQPEAGHKLRELETSAAELERAARALASPDYQPQPTPQHLRKLANQANRFGQIPITYVRRTRAALKRWAKPVAGAVRATVGLITETIFYVLLALGGLCAIALAIMLLAPPA